MARITYAPRQRARMGARYPTSDFSPDASHGPANRLSGHFKPHSRTGFPSTHFPHYAGRLAYHLGSRYFTGRLPVPRHTSSPDAPYRSTICIVPNGNAPYHTPLSCVRPLLYGAFRDFYSKISIFFFGNFEHKGGPLTRDARRRARYGASTFLTHGGSLRRPAK